MSSLPSALPSSAAPPASWANTLSEALLQMSQHTDVDALLGQVADHGPELSGSDAVVVSVPTRAGWQVHSSSDPWLARHGPPSFLAPPRGRRQDIGAEVNAPAVHRLAELADEPSASVWARVLLAHGWQQLWWVPLKEPRRGALLGALGFYVRSVYPPCPTEATALFSLHVALAWTRLKEYEQLSAAVEARHRVGLAQGLLMARYRIDADQAFAAMQRYSQNDNVKLRDVAAGVVRTGELPR